LPVKFKQKSSESSVDPSIDEGESGGSSSFEDLMIQPRKHNKYEKINNEIDFNDGQ
jgi:hypothetical protein